jgi:hypothetical protein
MVTLLKISFIVSVIQIPVAFSGKPEVPSWIKLRAYGDSYHLNATGMCWGGGWAPESIPGECICIKGIWAVSTGLCDSETTIYTGEGHCFRMEKKKVRETKDFASVWHWVIFSQ